MPRIPVAADLKASDPSVAPTVVERDRTAGLIARTQGEVVTGVTDSLNEAMDANSRYEASKAISDLVLKKVELDNDNYEDVEYGNIPTTYDERFAKAREEVGQSLRSNTARRYFDERAEQLYAQGLNTATRKAKAREVDVERGAIVDRLNKLRESAVTGEDVESVNVAAQEIINAGVDNGYFGAEEAVKQYKAWRDDAAVGRVKMMAPEDQIAALNEPWAKNIPSDVRATLKRNAEKLNLAVQSELNAENYIGKNMTRAEALAATNDIKNDKERLQTRDEVNAAYDRAEKNEKEEQSEIYNTLAMAAEGDPDFKLAQVDEETLEKLTPAMRSNLRQLEQNRSSGGPKVSDREVIFNLNALYNNPATRERSLEYFRENSARLNASDFEQWAKAVTGNLEPEIKPLFTATASLNARAKDMRLGDQQKAQLQDSLNDWYMAIQQTTGKIPSGDDIERKMDSLLLKVDLTPSKWLDRDMYLFQVTAEEAESRDPDRWNAVRRLMPNASEQDVLDTYRAFLKDDLESGDGG